MKPKRKYTILPCRKCVTLPMCMSLYHEWYINRNFRTDNGKRNPEFKDADWLPNQLRLKCSSIRDYTESLNFNTTDFEEYMRISGEREIKLFVFMYDMYRKHKHHKYKLT
jgi:hypothetical protein